MVLLSLCSCAFDGMRLKRPEELGTEKEDYILESTAGGTDIQIYANMPGRISLLEGSSWARLSADSFDGDAVLHVEVSPNPSFRRMAEVLLETEARRDTVYIKQEGDEDEFFRMNASSVVAYNASGDTKIDMSTNIEPAEFSFRTVYLDASGDQWIKTVHLSSDQLAITTSDNPGEDIRTAVVTISYTNGWKEKMQWTLNVTQANSTNHIGNVVSFEELRAMATSTPEVLDDIILSGYIVSDKNSGNMGDNVQTTNTTIDYSVCERSAYMESTDGRFGVLLEFASSGDNSLELNSLVTLNLKGAQLVKYADPNRYVISRLSASNISSAETVSEDVIPKKEKNINALTDEDLYTRVTLINCEFPVRKGSLTPFNEGYTLVNNTHRIAKYPSLIRCKDGGSIYMFTNTTCPYRRDGSRLGYGSGTVTGIIVHEKYRRFVDSDAEDEEDCGTIGRYQIRHMSREGIAFQDSFRDGFSEMICEWRYLPVGNADGSWEATYGHGTMDHSFQGTTHPVFRTHAYPIIEFSYLGPVNRADKSNENAFGIILEDGTDYGKDYDAGNIDKGVLPVNNSIALAWMREAWWNDAGNVPEYWVVHFSTAGISTDQLSLQLSTLNVTSEGYSPIQWKVQWAESNNPDTHWEDIAQYSVPDVVQWNATQYWQSAAYKPVNIPLPLSLLGKTDVYIRLIPRNRLGSTLQGYLDAEYRNGAAGTTKANNALNYLAIRYNK